MDAERRNRIRSNIIDYALQIARLETMGVSIDVSGSTILHCLSDVPNQVDYYKMKLSQESEFLLSQLTVNGHEEEI